MVSTFMWVYNVHEIVGLHLQIAVLSAEITDLLNCVQIHCILHDGLSFASFSAVCELDRANLDHLESFNFEDEHFLADRT